MQCSPGMSKQHRRPAKNRNASEAGNAAVNRQQRNSNAEIQNDRSSNRGSADCSLRNAPPFSRPWWIAALAITLILATVIGDLSAAPPIQLDGVYRYEDFGPVSPMNGASPIATTPVDVVIDPAVIPTSPGHHRSGRCVTELGRINPIPVGDVQSRAIFDAWQIDRAIRNRRLIRPLVPISTGSPRSHKH